MPILEVTGQIDLQDPILVVAISGWVDAGAVSTAVGGHLTSQGKIVAAFDPDAVFDYSSSRPTMEFDGGAAAQIHWPSLSITAVPGGRNDLLVMTGTEPDSSWQAASAELARLATAAGVTKVVAVGAIASAVPHTLATPIMISSTDPDLEPVGIPAARFSVPASFVNATTHLISEQSGIPSVGFWAQVPHYVSGIYWPAAEALLTRMSGFLDVDLDLTELHSHAQEMLTRLNEAVADRPDAMEFIRSLEAGTPGFAFDDGSNIADEVESFLRGVGDDDNPFG
ncbi:filament polymerization regulator ParJ [soil metagenome]